MRYSLEALYLTLKAYQTFLDYKMSVPTCGCIILNESLTKVLLVRGWKASASWGFPKGTPTICSLLNFFKGKINKNEAEVECAVREVLEETGFDVSSNIRSNEYIERTFAEQRQRLYIVTGISEVTVFETRTRMEIGVTGRMAFN